MYTITYIECGFLTVRAFLEYGRFDGFSFRVGKIPSVGQNKGEVIGPPPPPQPNYGYR